MPSSKNYKRDYKQENKYKKKPAQIKKRVARNKARRKMIREGRAFLGDGTHIDHKDGNPLNNKSSNLRKMSASKNSSYPRTRKAKKKNPRD